MNGNYFASRCFISWGSREKIKDSTTKHNKYLEELGLRQIK